MRNILLAGIAFTVAAAGCGPVEIDDGKTPGTGTRVAGDPVNGIGGGAHIMPVRQADQRQADAAPSNAHLTYYGGPVIANPKVYTIFWNSSVQYQSQLNQFYTAYASSSAMDWLSEYDTSSQSIGRGSLIGSHVDTGAPTGTTIDDSQIQSEISRLISTGGVPAPDGNTLYMVHFPPGLTITQGGQRSCSYFCAYHGTYTRNGAYVYYGVIPDMGGACASGCGTGTQFNNTTSVASHEFIEAVTDAAVGVAQSLGSPIAWYDQTNGEIGDICNGTDANVSINGTTYVVQTEWSNSRGTCYMPTSATTSSGGSCTPNCSGKTCGSDGCGGSCGTCGAGSTCSSSGTCVASCTPSCSGKVCGSDGCGGSCGSCGSGATCNSSGQCVSSTGGGGTQLIVNGGFESANYTGWTPATGVNNITSVAHSGKYGARVGSLNGYNGDSILYQQIAVPSSGTTTLSFWYILSSSDTYQYDQQQAFITDTSQNVLHTIFDTCSDTGGQWQQATADLTPYAGKTVLLYFLDHDDGYSGDPTYMRIDDVSVVH